MTGSSAPRENPGAKGPTPVCVLLIGSRKLIVSPLTVGVVGALITVPNASPRLMCKRRGAPIAKKAEWRTWNWSNSRDHVGDSGIDSRIEADSLADLQTRHRTRRGGKGYATRERWHWRNGGNDSAQVLDAKQIVERRIDDLNRLAREGRPVRIKHLRTEVIDLRSVTS